jgi:hypothetical protein
MSEHMAAKWFEKNAGIRFGGSLINKRSVLWVCGFGKLRGISSARDTQVHVRALKTVQ